MMILAATVFFGIEKLPVSADESRRDPVPAVGSGKTAENSSQPAPGDEQPVPMDRQTTEFVRGLILLLLPGTFEDSDGWGNEKRIQSGLNVDIDGGRVATSRRWKSVNHGSWKQVSGTLKNPEERFRLQLQHLPRSDSGVSRYQLKAEATVRATGRQQQWSYGVMLWSISAEAEFDIVLNASFSVEQRLADADGRSKLQLIPVVEKSHAEVTRFSLRRISHAKGSAVREFGSWFEWLIRDLVKKENRSLTEKINRKLQQKQDRLSVPLWFSSLPADAEPMPAVR